MGEITHDEAAKHLDFVGAFGNAANPEYAKLHDYIRQQRAASVRVVQEIVGVRAYITDHDGTALLPLHPGQSLAIIERPAEAAAGEGVRRGK